MDQRTVLIVKLLLENDSVKTLGAIASALDVSSKTISRHLPKVEALLASYDLTLERRAGTGLQLLGSPVKKFALSEHIKKALDRKEYSPKERLSVIISRLLSSREPIKLFVLSSQLRVTDSTISNDLDKLEPWFRDQGLRLLRKPGLGISLLGDERDLRRAIVRYIHEHVGEDDLLQLVHDNLSGADSDERITQASKFLLELIDEGIWRRLDKIIHTLAVNADYQLSDNAFVGLTVHLSLAVKRIKNHEALQLDDASLKKLQSHREYKIAAALAQKIRAEFDIEMPDSEIGYITAHILGARNRYDTENIGTVSMMDNFRLVRLARSVMKTAARETGRDIDKNQNLLAGLVNHFGPSISRLKMNMDIRNPLLNEIKIHYPELMALTKKCVGEVERDIGRELPEAEIAYIAMHLGAALADSEPFLHSEHRVVVACPTGMGTSRLLASRLRSQFRNVRIVDQVPTLSINPTYVASMEFEFVISTVPIPHAPCPVVVVNTALTREDRQAIENELSRQNEKFLSSAEVIEARLSFVDALKKLTEYGLSITALLTNWFFIRAEVQSIDEACATVGRHVGRTAIDSDGIKRDLLSREDKGSTVLTGHHMVLLHCKSRHVETSALGILQLGRGFEYPTGGEQVRTAIVMLAPLDSSECVIETIGHAASVLLDRWGFIEILHEGDEREIYAELEKIFKAFFESKRRDLIG